MAATSTRFFGQAFRSASALFRIPYTNTSTNTRPLSSLRPYSTILTRAPFTPASTQTTTTSLASSSSSPSPSPTSVPTTQGQQRLFTTTTPLYAKKKKQGKAGDKSDRENAAKIKALKSNLFARAPPPLRMGRNRWLRHWTIHRAWVVYQRQLHLARQAELMRQYQGMQAACDELYKTSGPGKNQQGYLYRLAMQKIGVYHNGYVPIEYARLQTDMPARSPWNHDWKR